MQEDTRTARASSILFDIVSKNREIRLIASVIPSLLDTAQVVADIAEDFFQDSFVFLEEERN